MAGSESHYEMPLPEFEKPVMLYSIGKDSSVLLHLALKAFYPAKPPFPLMHVDTTFKFKEMIKFREEYARKELGLDVIVHINEEGVAAGMNPFDHGSKKHTDVMKTESLLQALNKYRFDAAFAENRKRRNKNNSNSTENNNSNLWNRLWLKDRRTTTID